MKARTVKILTLIFLALFVFSGIRLIVILAGYKEAEKHYASLEQYVSPPADQTPDPAPTPEPPAKEETPPPSPPPAEEETPPISPPPTEEQPPQSETPSQNPEDPPVPPPEPQYPRVDFESLAAINSDVVAWLMIDDTEISFPVVQGEDNKYYLKHQFDKKWSTTGCLFLDALDDPQFQKSNQIIYGHNMKAKTMFHDLLNYEKQEFYDAHPSGWLITPTGAFRLQFFSAYVSDNYGSAWDTSFEDAAAYKAWLEECARKSLFTPVLSPTETDRVLTLSTCSYVFDNAKFVVHAIMQKQ